MKKRRPCLLCGKTKNSKSFHKCNRGTTLSSYCKACTKERDRERYIKNQEKYRERSRVYHETHKQEIAEYDRKRYYADLALSRQKSKESYRRNIDKKRKRGRDYAKRPEVAARRRFLRKERRQNDPIFKLKCDHRKMLRQTLNRQGVAKSCESLPLLGCTVEFLKTHLESQFKPGMTWDNWTHAGWHIDHIRPLSSFDLSKQDDLLKAFHYTNLQPLWAFDNFSKGSKIL